MNSPLEMQTQDLRQAAADAIIRVKQAALDTTMSNAVSAQDMQDAINRQAQLKALKVML